jgi:hypothetical protein
MNDKQFLFFFAYIYTNSLFLFILKFNDESKSSAS